MIYVFDLIDLNAIHETKVVQLMFQNERTNVLQKISIILNINKYQTRE
jgi:hypothetical protein